MIYIVHSPLLIPPSSWGNCFCSGAAEEATAVFGEAASLCVQKQYTPHGLASQSLPASTEDRNALSARNYSSQDLSPRQLKNTHGNTLKENPGNYHGTAFSGGANQPINGGLANMSFYNTPSPMATQVINSIPSLYRWFDANQWLWVTFYALFCPILLLPNCLSWRSWSCKVIICASFSFELL